MHALTSVVHQSRADGAIVLLSDVHMQPLVALTGSTALREIGEGNLFGNLDDALNRAREHLGLPAVVAPDGVVPTVRRESRETVRPA
jgi:SulP family sulfate permease